MDPGPLQKQRKKKKKKQSITNPEDGRPFAAAGVRANNMREWWLLALHSQH